MRRANRRAGFAGICVRFSAAALVVIANAGCNTIPGVSRTWSVGSAVERGEFIDASLSRGGETRRYFLPKNEACRGMLRVEGSVEVVALGPLGQLQQGETVCDPLGIGSLREWRESRPRPEAPPLPSRQATYRLDFEDQEVAMLRGRFPLLGLIGFPGLGDTLVVIPQSEPCRPLREATVATIEYRVAGPDPFVLIAGRERCPVLGLIQPVGAR